VELPTAPDRQRLENLATLAIVGQIVLLASALLLPIVSEYSLIGDNISELAIGRFGAVQTLAFVIAGVGTLGLAYLIRQLTQGTWGSRVGSLLVGVYGIGSLLVAIFPTERVDRPEDVASLSTVGLIHVVVAFVSFVSMTVAIFVLTRTFLLEPRWCSLSRWMALFPAAALSLLIVQSQGPWVGLMQRLLVGVISAWIIVVALRGRAIAATLNPPATARRRHPPGHLRTGSDPAR
jgi:hypothetical protein